MTQHQDRARKLRTALEGTAIILAGLSVQYVIGTLAAFSQITLP